VILDFKSKESKTISPKIEQGAFDFFLKKIEKKLVF